MITHYERIVEDDDGNELERTIVTSEVQALRQRVADLQELLAFVRRIALDLDSVVNQK